MSRPFRLLFLLLLLSILPVAADAACNLQMTMTCTPGSPSSCRSTTTNVGSESCGGEYFTGFFSSLPPDAASLSGFSNSLGLGECFDASQIPGVTQAFVFCFGGANLAPGQSFTASVNASSAGAIANFPVIGVTGVFDPESGEDLAFVYAFNGIEVPSCTPSIAAPPIAQSESEYSVSWGAVSDPNTMFQLEESTSADFSSGVNVRTVSSHSQTFRHTVTSNTTYYYRVRATSCGGQGAGPYSNVVAVVVQAPQAANPSAREASATVPFGSTDPVRIPVFLPGTAQQTQFTAAVDKPYLSVSPSSGTVGPNGTTITVTANPADLPPGANTGTLTVTAANGTALKTTPVSVSLVTPVTPGGKSTPPANALMIPVVTHVNGAAALFQSDVRITNGGGAAVNYHVTFTPTRTNGTQSGKSTQIRIDAGQTVALNDIAKDFFGFGATGDPNDVGFGSLEIRPLNNSTTQTYASSRTYANTPGGTFGQYIAAVPFTQFATNALSGIPLPGQPTPGGLPILSLQQVAHSARFRTNLGIVEGSGTPAAGRIRVVSSAGEVLREVGFQLQPGEHQQLNSFIAGTGITNLEDGRIEIHVDSPTGAVTAYASVLDNTTTDPLAVMPARASAVNESRYTLPGMAELNNGPANFHSDIRIFNGSVQDTTATLTYYPQGGGAPVAAQPITIRGGEVRAFDNVLPSLFGVNSGGGSILITTNGPSSLVATGRTYSIGANNGTFGQFIPGISPSEGTAVGQRPLQILQLEQSQNFRSNVGLAELSGNPARVRLTLVLPDTKTNPVLEVDLAPNEFRQINALIAGLNPGQNTYNARVTVEVLSGTGRVTAYGSVIDNATQDPTYVPAQ